uniref:Cell number regulator 8 n=1 Tax=Rhizophora mucronata TaxID=61149 RepID=A0A2P2JEU0_RHIMU
MDAATTGNGDSKHIEQLSPLLSKDHQERDEKQSSLVDSKVCTDSPPAKAPAKGSGGAGHYQWTADGLPLGHGSVVGEPMGRSHWNSGILACLGRNDEFCSSDLEVCLLGSIAPCVLYGSNAERLGSSPGTFANHCLSYSGLYLIGNSIFGCNFLAPWFSYTSRTAIRRKFNLEGSCEALNRSCGCCGSCLEDEFQREQLESSCDFAMHFCCHQCALCQEGREIRRRVPHPGYNAQPVLVTIPPSQQTMGRKA